MMLVLFLIAVVVTAFSVYSTVKADQKEAKDIRNLYPFWLIMSIFFMLLSLGLICRLQV